MQHRPYGASLTQACAAITFGVLFVAACTDGTPIITSPSDGSSSNQASSPSPDGGGTSGGGPAGPASSAQFTVTGPSGCRVAAVEPLTWQLVMSDAGPSAVRFVALTHHSDSPGCDPTVSNPRERVSLGGTLTYAAHASGTTTFELDSRVYSCGRVQVNVALRDADGRELPIAGAVLDYRRPCDPPPATPPTASPVCAPLTQTVAPGEYASLQASAGDGSYVWSAPGARIAPRPGEPGSSARLAYDSQGPKLVTVTSGTRSTSCTVIVTPPRPLSCATVTPVALIGQVVVFFGSGGTGWYAWEAPGSQTPAVPEFALPGGAPGLVYLTSGIKTVTAISGTDRATCQTTIAP